VDLEILEQRECQAVLAGDVEELERLWHMNVVVNAPNNTVIQGRDVLLDLVRGGIIAYNRFTRSVEYVSVVSDVGIAMGLETVQRKAGPQEGQILERRYTNVWRRLDGNWQMVARQASIIVGQQDLGASAD
jgi:ketosteroid isomerase-like protein